MLIRKELMLAERRFRRLDAPELLADVYDGRAFDGGAVVKSNRKKKGRLLVVATARSLSNYRAFYTPRWLSKFRALG